MAKYKKPLLYKNCVKKRASRLTTIFCCVYKFTCVYSFFIAFLFNLRRIVWMNKRELADAISNKADLSKKDAEAFLSAFVDCVSEALVRGEKVQIVGFGSFEVTHRAARTCRNPQTGKNMEIPATKAVRLKVGKLLKDKVSGAE